MSIILLLLWMNQKSISPLKILVIDDNPFDQLIISKALGESDVTIQLANSATEAKKMIESNIYALVICDISMPEISGFDFIKEIKKEERFKHIPVVFFSAKKETDELSKEAYELGALDIISKERSPVKLRGRLAALIKQVDLQRQLQIKNIELDESLKSDQELLSKVLPEHTLKQLREEDATNKLYESTTVMFADFSDFTRLSKHSTPSGIIEKLNAYFCAFDEIAEKYHVEKIKTIGDSYMCAGGVPEECSDHAFMTVLCALEMRHFVNEKAKEDVKAGIDPWYIKFGVSSGEVVSGIVGTTKFMFDIWGDTVNVASRLEGIAKKNCITISEATKVIIEKLFITESLGVKSLRNWGDVEVYNVLRIKEEFSSTTDGQFPNDAFFKEVSEMS